ncbi:MAG TPA: ion channel [Rhizomicrobium sp.]|jgi:inward rectifier potassium channel|nr:ion channel [Rhizomicrobium sp.]
MIDKTDPRNPQPSPAFRPGALSNRGRLAIVKGQDRGQYTDVYHAVLRAPWWAFFLGLAGVFLAVNAIFALAYVLDRGGIDHARPGNFWDAFVFSAQTIGSINYSVMVPKSDYVNILVIVEAFTGYLVLALFTGLTFARFSRPFARVVFSKVAVITPFDGTPTLMFRAANQRGNQVLDAAITVTLAREHRTREGMVFRRFEELKLVRARTSLFALSWTIMHPIDEASPLYGVSCQDMVDKQMEVVALLSGADATMAETIYARYSYGPDDIVRDHRFVDVLSVTPKGQRMVDLTRFHDTEPMEWLRAEGG